MFLNSKPKVGLPEKLGRIATVAVFVLLLLFLLPLGLKWPFPPLSTSFSPRVFFVAVAFFFLLGLLCGMQDAGS